MFQTHKCLQKFSEEPKVTDVSLQKSSDINYPDLTFCRQILTSHYEEQLKKCNLTKNEYENIKIWFESGNPNCTNPVNLYLDMVGNPWDIVKSVQIEDFSSN